jgi:hypothetical protein
MKNNSSIVAPLLPRSVGVGALVKGELAIKVVGDVDASGKATTRLLTNASFASAPGRTPMHAGAA